MMSEWQPIETAPKDGTIILVSDKRSVSAAYWGLAPRASGLVDRNYPWTMLDETNGLNGWMDGPSGPTHWMPLPAPPTGDTK